MRLSAIMSRVGLGVCVVLVVGSIAAVARSRDLQISHQFAAGVDSRDRAARIFVDEALKRAPHLRISLHPELSLKIKATEQFGAMARGELAMSIFPLSYEAHNIPEFAIATFPFVPADLDMAARLKGTPFHRKLQSLAEANGVRILTWWWLPGGLASRQRDIGGPATVKGLVSRTPGVDMDRLFEAAGARSSGLMASTEMAAAMRAGKLDFLVTSLESLVTFRVHETAKYALIGGVGGFMSLHPLMMSKAVWDGLTIDEQQAIEDAADIADKAFETMQREAEVKALAAFGQRGVKVRTMNIDEYEAWNRLAKDAVWPGYRKIGPAADGLFVSLLTSLARSGRATR